MWRRGLEAVLFDLDGTLVDSATAWRAAFDETVAAIAQRHPQVATGDATRIYEEVYVPLVAEEHAAAGGGEWDRAFVQRALRRMLAAVVRADDGFADALYEAYYEAWPRHINLFPDALPALEALGARYRLALVTNGQSREQRLKVEQLGLQSHFEVIAVSEEVGTVKPEPAIFEHVLAALDVPPSRAVHVGDDLRADVGGARLSGMGAVWINRAGTADADGHAPHAVVGTLGGMVWLLEGADQGGG